MFKALPDRDAPAEKPIAISIASASDREAIYALRHQVYATELHQHHENADRRLTDALDDRNVFLVARQDGRVVGFVSLTLPGGTFSIDKYFRRDEIPISLDNSVYEIRLLTVVTPHRGRLLAGSLMYAALRFADAQGGKRLIGIGRREVLELYVRCGMQPLGLKTQSGAVQYELMSADIEDVYAAIRGFSRQLRRMQANVDWQLPFPFERADHCLHGGRFWEAFGDDFSDLSRAGLAINADVLDAWFDPAPAVLDSIRQHLPLLLKTSPPTHAEGLVEAIAHARRIPAASILPAAGSSALIFLALQSWLTPRSRVLLLEPTYGEYRHVLEHVIGCQVHPLLAREEDGFAVDAERLRERLAEDYDLVVLVNPNSPTGTFLPRSVLSDLCEQHARTRFWIDETYIEYTGAQRSMEERAADSANVFVCKSMSKVYALSGVRVAYLVGPASELARLKIFSPPWSVSLPAQVAAVAALASSAYYHDRYMETAELRATLAADLLARCGIQAFPSFTNWLLCRLPENAPLATSVVQRARRRNLYVRAGEEIHPVLGPKTLRIAVKDIDSNRRIVDILASILHQATDPQEDTATARSGL